VGAGISASRSPDGSKTDVVVVVVGSAVVVGTKVVVVTDVVVVAIFVSDRCAQDHG